MTFNSLINHQLQTEYSPDRRVLSLSLLKTIGGFPSVLLVINQEDDILLFQQEEFLPTYKHLTNAIMVQILLYTFLVPLSNLR